MSTIATTIATIASLLHTAIGVFVAREARPRPVVWLGTRAFAEPCPPRALPALPQPAWALFRDRLARLATRFQVLFDRWQSNTLPTPRAPRPGQACRPDPRPILRPTRRPVPRLPRAHGWAARRMPEAAPSSGRLQSLLHDPTTRAFVAAAPQAGRLLRPLCRALGIAPPDWLALPRRPRTPRAPRRPQAPPEVQPATPERPLQPYVRAAVRAWKKKSTP